MYKLLKSDLVKSSEIRTGDGWRQKLYEFIDKDDTFLLFWSEGAKKSEEVLKEAQRANKRTGKNRKNPSNSHNSFGHSRNTLTRMVNCIDASRINCCDNCNKLKRSYLKNILVMIFFSPFWCVNYRKLKMQNSKNTVNLIETE